MSDIQLILSVIGLFFIRIGIPVLLLVILGTLIDRWQRNQFDRHDDNQGRAA